MTTHMKRMHEAKAAKEAARREADDTYAAFWLDTMRAEAQAYSKRGLDSTYREDWKAKWTAFSHMDMPTDAALRRVRGES